MAQPSSRDKRSAVWYARLISVGALLINLSGLQADTIITWTGSSSTWATPGNWSPNSTAAQLAAADGLLISTGTKSTVDNINSLTINSLTIATGYSVRAGNSTAPNAVLTIENGGDISSGGTLSTYSNSNCLSCALIVSGNMTVDGTIKQGSGTVQLGNGSFATSLSGGGTLSGTMSTGGTGGVSISGLTFTGGTLTATTPTSFSGTNKGGVIQSGATGAALSLGNVTNTGAASIVDGGSGVTILSGSTVAGGTLSSGTFTNNGTVSGATVASATVSNASGVVSGGALTGSSSINGGTVTGAVTASGATAAMSGVTIDGNGTVSIKSGTLTLNGNTPYGPVINNGTIGTTNGALVINGPVTNNGEIKMSTGSQPGQLTINGTVTGGYFDGGTAATPIINNGTIVDGSFTYLHNGLYITGGTIAGNSYSNNAAGHAVFTNLTQTGTLTSTISTGTSFYTMVGGTNLGTLTTQSGAGFFIGDGGSGEITVNTGNINTGSGTGTAAISAGTTLENAGGVVNGSGGPLTISGIVAGGTVEGAIALAGGAIEGVTFDTQTATSVTSTGASTISGSNVGDTDLLVASGTLSVDSDTITPGHTTTVNGTLSAGTLVNNGGLLLVNGTAMAPGFTQISGEMDLNGTLSVDAAALLGGTLVGSPSGVLDAATDGSGSIVNSGAVVDVNSGNGALTFDGNYTQSASAGLSFDINSAGPSDLLDITGTLDWQGGTINVASSHGVTGPVLLIDTGGINASQIQTIEASATGLLAGWSIQVQGNDVWLYAPNTPEPETMLLSAAGVLLILLAKRRPARSSEYQRVSDPRTDKQAGSQRRQAERASRLRRIAGA